MLTIFLKHRSLDLIVAVGKKKLYFVYVHCIV